MDPKNETVDQIVAAFKRQLIYEKVVLAIWVLFYAAIFGWSITFFLYVTLGIQVTDSTDYILTPLNIIFMVFFVINMITIIYFLRMALNYLKILSQFDLNRPLILAMIFGIAALTTITLIGRLMYPQANYFIQELILHENKWETDAYQIPLRIFLYLQQLTPYCLAIFVNVIIAYFAKSFQEDEEEEDEEQADANSFDGGDGFGRTVKGSINLDEE